jgi:arsenate reductase
MKKAFAWLEGNGVAYQFHDYKKAGVPNERLAAWVKQCGWERLVNTKGTTFRQLPQQQQQGLNATKAAALMQEAPSLIKRPVIDGGKNLLVGFDPDAYRAALK